MIKATFSVHKLIPKNAQMTTLYTNSQYPGWPICVAPDGTVISKAMHSGYMVDMTHHMCIANKENR